jgi:uncharacterized protein (TIGR02996 family)
MTNEEDFQAALDTNPADWQTRLVFADWLQERGDPRADGYRALGRTGAWTVNVNTSGEGLKLWTWFPTGTTSDGRRELPRDWFRALDAWECLVSSGETMNAADRWRDYRSRREAEDAAALAFANLAPERRAELLAGTLPDATESAPKKPQTGSRESPSPRKPKGRK